MTHDEMNEYIFLDNFGYQLGEATCHEHEAREEAQALAQEFNGRLVTIARFVEVVQPRKCDRCEATLNADYTCPDCGRNQ